MITTFDSFSNFYDDWRINGEFFNDFEVPIAEHLIRSSLLSIPEPQSALDIGTGTGIWCQRTSQIANELNIDLKLTGIDNSVQMIKCAQNSELEKNTDYFHMNCEHLANSNVFSKKFDLISLALSIDYIGLTTVERAITNSLSSKGICLFWFFDPSRYPGNSRIHSKKWYFQNEYIHFSVPNFSIDDLFKTFNTKKWELFLMRHPLPLVNKVNRSMYFVIIKFRNSHRSQIQTKYYSKNNVFKSAI